MCTILKDIKPNGVVAHYNTEYTIDQPYRIISLPSSNVVYVVLFSLVCWLLLWGLWVFLCFYIFFIVLTFLFIKTSFTYITFNKTIIHIKKTASIYRRKA